MEEQSDQKRKLTEQTERRDHIGIQPLLSGFAEDLSRTGLESASFNELLGEPDGRVILAPEDQQALLDRLEMAAAVLPAVREERVLRKAVQAVHSFPINGEHTLVTRKVVNGLIEHAQQVMRKFSPDELTAMRRFRITPRFTVSVKRLLDLTEMGQENYGRIYDAVDRIYSWSIKWNLMGDGDYEGAATNDARVLQRPLAFASAKPPGDRPVDEETFDTEKGMELTDDCPPDGGMASMKIIERVNSRLISQWSRGEGPRQGVVAYEFPVDVLWMLLEPKIYAQIQMRVLNSLGSPSAAAIYENCVRYFGSSSKVTPQLPIREWMNLIVGPKSYQAEGRLPDFKRFVIEPALKNIAASDACPFTVEALWIKGPRNKVIALQFKLHAKRQLKLDMETPLAWHPRTTDVLRKVFGLSELEISEIARSADEAEVRQTLDVYAKVSERKAKRGEVITDRAKYLRGILRNLQEGRKLEEGIDSADDPVESMSANARQASEQMAEFKDRFERHRQARVVEELMRLPADQYTRLQTSFIELHSTHVAVQRFVSKGWNPPHPAVAGLFARWFMTNHPQTVDDMLTRQEDKDFAYWLVLQSMPVAKA